MIGIAPAYEHMGCAPAVRCTFQCAARLRRRPKDARPSGTGVLFRSDPPPGSKPEHLRTGVAVCPPSRVRRQWAEESTLGAIAVTLATGNGGDENHFDVHRTAHPVLPARGARARWGHCPGR